VAYRGQFIRGSRPREPARIPAGGALPARTPYSGSGSCAPRRSPTARREAVSRPDAKTHRYGTPYTEPKPKPPLLDAALASLPRRFLSPPPVRAGGTPLPSRRRLLARFGRKLPRSLKGSLLGRSRPSRRSPVASSLRPPRAHFRGVVRRSSSARSLIPTRRQNPPLRDAALRARSCVAQSRRWPFLIFASASPAATSWPDSRRWWRR